MKKILQIIPLVAFGLYADFSIEESGKAAVTISESGTIESSAISETVITPPNAGDNVLLFEKEGDVDGEVEAAVWIKPTGEIEISNEYKPKTAIPAGGFSFAHGGELKASVSLEKNLHTLQGQSSLEQIVSYVGDFAVFESGVDGFSTLSYENFAEGQISHEGTETQRRYYVKDHLGTPRVVLQEDAENTVELTQHYHSYGRLNAISQNNEGATSIREGYIGLEFDTDGETNDALASGIRLNYHNARYLDNDIGMFTAVDPLHEFNSGFLYTRNPINSFDPDGLSVKYYDDEHYEFIFDGKGFDVGFEEAGERYADYLYSLRPMGPYQSDDFYTRFERDRVPYFPVKYISLYDIYVETENHFNMWGQRWADMGFKCFFIDSIFFNAENEWDGSYWSGNTATEMWRKPHYIISGLPDGSKYHTAVSNELNYIAFAPFVYSHPLGLSVKPEGLTAAVEYWKTKNVDDYGVIDLDKTLYWTQLGYKMSMEMLMRGSLYRFKKIYEVRERQKMRKQ